MLGIQSPFLNQKQAAIYLNVSPRTFREYLEKYDIPKKGPCKNRYSIYDLETFMDAPEQFKKGTIRTKLERQNGFSPVNV